MLTDLHRERAYPYAGGLLAGVAVFALAKAGYSVSYSENMLASLVSLGGIFAGFLATVKTLLLTMNSETLRSLRTSGYMGDLLTYLKEGIYGSLILCVLAMLGFNEAMRWPSFHAATLYSALFFSLLALYRISRISIALLLDQTDGPDND
ncbi:hypothetical protein [Stenotrophomonas maltophilia]|uniref:hypothetical protein n=1 Tax=Stenotrophomonas maltophilia TaxID=40324 RepID=UPI0013D95FB1|nr:hypothetical protein [Stenotrophomonas maltophilia]